MTMSLPVLAVTRGDIASYVSSLFTVFIVLIFLRILLSWVPRMPDNRAVRAVVQFIHEMTDPYLNFFRRFLPPVGGGGMALDLSPMVGVIVLFIAQAVVVGIVRG